jgi:oxaloacetate decarboxylase (Na+ extruding) subunit alpha
MAHMKGVEAGAVMIDTCISAFSEGASHPTTESLVAALAGTEYDTGINLIKLQEIAAYFKEVRKKYWQFEMKGQQVDSRILVSQVPGGMISNLVNQLKEQGRSGPHGCGAGGNPARARRPGLPAAGHADLADRRHPGGAERTDRRPLQIGDQRSQELPARPLRRSAGPGQRGSQENGESASRK